MKRHRFALTTLAVVTLGTAAMAALLNYDAAIEAQDDHLEFALTELASAEARLDSDVLRVVSLQLPNYDQVVRSVWELDLRRNQVADDLKRKVFTGNEKLQDRAGRYLAVLDRKAELLENLKGEAAFLRNQISYIPFAVQRELPVLSLPARDRLSAVTQQMLIYHAHASDEEARRLTSVLDQAAGLAGDPAVGALLRHVRVYAEHRRDMNAMLAAYFAQDQDGWRQQTRAELMTQLSADQRRMWIIGGVLGAFVVSLLLALSWTVVLLNGSRRQAVQTSERFAKAIDSMNGAFALYDSDHRLVMHNARYADYYAPAAGMIAPGMLYDDFVRALTEAGYFPDVAETERDGFVGNLIERAGTNRGWGLKVAGGRCFECSHRSTSDGGFICYSTDQTEKKEAEEKLQRLYTAVEQSPASIIITDISGTIQYVNPWFCRITGFSREEVLGQNPRILKSGAVSDAEYLRLWNAITSGEVWTGELCNKKKSGELYWESASISPVRDDEGRIASFVGVKRDITEEKASSAKLERMVAELERSNAELEQFAYVASHDLREPLRMVSSYVSLLARRYADKLDGDALEFIAFAKDGARRMDRLILDLLDYSRIGRLSQPAEPVDLSSSLDDALRNLQPLIDENGARIVHDAPLPVVQADPLEMLRLLQNLVGNALKYRAPNRAPEITVSAEHLPGEWVVTVADNGIGIAPEYYERIFGIFQRLHAHGEYEGTGIGLAICRKIVQHHGGRIWVESDVGRGSRFRFSLPEAEA